MEKEMVAITKDEYNKLIEAENKLSLLEMAGVDNWEGYEYAMSEEFRELNYPEDIKP